jgi:hypothetical protein
MASNAIVSADENPMKKFDAPVLKAMGSTQLDANAPRSMFMPSNMGEAMELAKLMAASNFVPAHLRGKAGDCLAVVMQAGRWAMDPFAVGNKSYFVNDRIAYEAQLVGAVLNSSGLLDGRLSYDWQGEGNDLVCTVSGKLKGDPEVKRRRVPIKNITTRNSPLWKQDPEQQLGYYAGRAWGRLYAPEVLMGVYTPDELSTAMGTAGASAVDGGELRVTAALIEQQASEEPEEVGEGRADAEMGEAQHDPETGELFEQPAQEPKRTAAQFVDGLIRQFREADDQFAIQRITTDNADEIERLETSAPKQHARLMEARDLAWDQFNG